MYAYGIELRFTIYIVTYDKFVQSKSFKLITVKNNNNFDSSMGKK